MAPTIHAGCVAIGGRGVLITGPSGSGKSDLALRLIDRGAVLVSDDRTVFRVAAGCLLASAPASLAGRMEVRGLGVLDFPQLAEAPVALLVALGEPVERLPEPASRMIEGVPVPCIALAALEPSAPIKVELALARVLGEHR